MIRSGATDEVDRASGQWAFVDVGFSRGAKSCGLLLGDGEPVGVTFAELRRRLVHLATSDAEPLNLVLEAPLSAAFNSKGNPTGRTGERRGSIRLFRWQAWTCAYHRS